MEEWDVNGRDVRVIDPLVPLPYPIDIMVREKAILLNLEAIRMVIQKDNVRRQAQPSREAQGDECLTCLESSIRIKSTKLSTETLVCTTK